MTAKLKATIERVKAGDADAIKATTGSTNAALIALYQVETGRRDFRTFKAWKEAGYSVKKGEKGFPIFSRPARVIAAENNKPTPITKSGKPVRFFTCYLFHDGQTERRTH